MTVNKKIVGAIVVLAVLGFVSIPASHASSVSVNLSPATNSANVTAYVNTTVTVSSNNSALKILGGVYYLLTPNLSVSKTFGSNSSVFLHMQDAIKDKDSNLSLNYLNISYQREHEILSNTSMMYSYYVKVVLNVTGVFNGSTANLAWRAFNTNQSMNITSGNDINHVSYAANRTYQNGTLNFTAFKTSMSSWNRSYDPATNTTTFNMGAGTTLNASFKATFDKNSSYLDVNVVRDPSYSIVTPGYAVANANSISVQSPPPTVSSPNNPYGLVVVVAVVVIAGLLVASYTRRRKSR